MLPLPEQFVLSLPALDIGVLLPSVTSTFQLYVVYSAKPFFAVNVTVPPLVPVFVSIAVVLPAQ